MSMNYNLIRKITELVEITHVLSAVKGDKGGRGYVESSKYASNSNLVHYLHISNIIDIARV